MATKRQILDKIDLYDAQVTAAESEYGFKRDQAIADGQGVLVRGEKTREQIDAGLQDLAKIVKAELTAKATARMPLLREICADIDSFEGEAPVEFEQVREMGTTILLAERAANALRN
jgi:hypothetical protein